MAMKEKREGKQQRSEQDLEVMAVPIYLSVNAEVYAGVFEVAGYLLLRNIFLPEVTIFFAFIDEQSCPRTNSPSILTNHTLDCITYSHHGTAKKDSCR